MRTSLLRRAKKAVSDSLPVNAVKDEGGPANTVSLYEKYVPFATPKHVEGIWRAPRVQCFTKEQFDKAYPPSYRGMRIGLPKPGTFMAKNIDPKFDEVSPLVWTFIFFYPLTLWFGYEIYHLVFPSEVKSH